jgi:hypothetical protein
MPVHIQAQQLVKMPELLAQTARLSVKTAQPAAPTAQLLVIEAWQAEFQA